jgi:hypothetical protein
MHFMEMPLTFTPPELLVSNILGKNQVFFKFFWGLEY